MSKAKKPDPTGRPDSTRREVRVNPRAMLLVGLAAVLVVPLVIAVKLVQDRAGRSALLREAGRQRDVAKRPDLALGYLDRYLQLAPDDLDALDQRAKLLAETAREPGAVNAAIQAHADLIARGPDSPARSEDRKRLASLYLKVYQYRAAEESAREYLRRGHEDDAEGHRLLARALEGAGLMGDAKALQAAVVEYEFAEARQPGDVASAERLAQIYRDKFSDRAKGMAVLDALIKHNPKSAPARLARSRFFASEGDARAASIEVDAAVRDQPGDVDARLVAAEAAANRGDPAAAHIHLAAIKPPRPDDIRVKVVEGLVELAEKRPDRAIKSWQDGLILANGADAELTWRLAHVLVQLGRVAEADPLISQFRRLTGGEEPLPSCRYLVGLSALKAGRTAEAITELESIRYKLDKALEGQLYQALGQAYETTREPARAVEAYTKATTSPGSGASPWLSLARLRASDNPDEEAAALDQGIAAIGPEPRLVAALARAQWKKQLALPRERRQWAELDHTLELGKKVAPDSTDLAIVRADYAATLGRHEDGLVILEAATKQDPTSSSLWVAQVEALNRLGRQDEAVARLDRAFAMAGEQAPFRVLRARFAIDRGEIGAARQTLLDGLARVPVDQRATLWKALGEFHQSQGDNANGRRAYLEWASIQPDSTEPRLALLNLAIEFDDAPAIAKEVEALRAIGGPRSVYWKIARAESLLRDRPGRPIDPKVLDEAASLTDEIKAATPRQPAGSLLEARLMERRDNPDEAIKAYERAIELKAGPIALRPLASLLAGLGRVDDLEALRKRSGGFSADLEKAIGAIMLRRGAPEQAKELAQRLVEGDPTGLDARAWQARVLGALGRGEEAEATLRNLVEQNPEAPAPWVQLLMFQVSRKDMAGASATVDRMRTKVKTDRPALLVALCYRIARRLDLADLAFDEAVRATPDEPATLQAAVDYYEATARPGRAEPLLRRVLADRPALDWARRRLALLLAAKVGNRSAWDEALSLVEIKSAADTPDDRLARAAVLAMGPKPRRLESIAILEALAVDIPLNTKVQEALARTLLTSGRSAEALDHATRAASGPDATAGAIRLLASLDLAAGKYDDADRQVSRLEADDPDEPSTIELRARTLKGQGKPAEAVALIVRAFARLERMPESFEAGRSTVKLLAALNEPDAAERVARRVATMGGSGTILLAEYLGSTGRFDEAASLYETACFDKSTAAAAGQSAMMLATMLKQDRWVNLADRLVDRATEVAPGSSELLFARAAIRHQQGRFEESARLYDDLAARQPSNLLFMNNCAWILSEELNRPAEGLKRVDALIAKVGGQPHTFDTRGVILTRLGRFDDAIRDLEAAEESIPSGPISYHLARAYLKAGRPEEASMAIDRARAAGLKPDDLQPSERAEMARLMAPAK